MERTGQGWGSSLDARYELLSSINENIHVHAISSSVSQSVSYFVPDLLVFTSQNKE